MHSIGQVFFTRGDHTTCWMSVMLSPLRRMRPGEKLAGAGTERRAKAYQARVAVLHP